MLQSQPNELTEQCVVDPELPKEILFEIRAFEAKCNDTLAKKRVDYGTANINMTGVHGVAIRMLDKVCRLVNLTKSDTQIIHNESLEDTLLDIRNYVMIAKVMRAKGQW